MNITLQRKSNGSYEGELNFKTLNVFARQVEFAKLEKEGYTVTPWKYWTDFNGALTKTPWLYKARKGKTTISIYV
jgi:hypothetical protein